MSSDQDNNDKTMLVIGCGLGRTGTSSLKMALNILGYKCYHWGELMKDENFSDYQEWDRLINDTEYRSNKQVWNKIFINKGWNATTDQPSSLFYKQLYYQYPNAKFILTTRECDNWFKSYTDSVHAFDLSEERWFMQLTSKLARVNVKLSYDNERYLFDNKTWGENIKDGNENKVRKMFEKWNEECIAFMKQHNNSDNLLVFSVKQGWEPLCRFLDKSIPNGIPFPHANKTDNLRNRSIKSHQFQNRINYAILSVCLLIIAILIVNAM